MDTETILLAVVLFAGLYMAWNIGANDVANAMGTSVGSGALTLKQAVLLAAVLEFSGAFFFGSHVSETVQKGIVDPNTFSQTPLILVYGMLASLLAAGSWLQIASYMGWPVSTTHSIVGAVIGFGVVAGGAESVRWDNVTFIVTSWVISPLAGGITAYYIFVILQRKIFYTFHPVEEAKRMAPLLIFIFATTFSQLMIIKGLQNIHLGLSPLQEWIISLCIGVASALIGYYLVQKIQVNPEAAESRPRYGPEVALGLEKAKKHLERVTKATSGEMRYQTSILLEEVEGLSSSLQQNIKKEVSGSEYRTVEKIFGYLQMLSASMMAFAHGANDVANAIGPLAAAVDILRTGEIAGIATIPTWALALGGGGIIFGLATWGWRVIETIGKKITELTPTRGFSAEFGAAATILIATRMGMPISTTHTLVGAVIGVGLARGIGALNLATTRDIIVSWVVTVPAGAFIAIGYFYIIRAFFG